MFTIVSLLVAGLALASANDYPQGRTGTTLTTREYDSAFQPQIYHDFGRPWNPAMFCPKGTYASGFRQKTDLGCAGGQECSGMNGIELMCSSEGGQKQLGWAKTEIDVPLGQVGNEIYVYLEFDFNNSYFFQILNINLNELISVS